MANPPIRQRLEEWMRETKQKASLFDEQLAAAFTPTEI